MHLLVAVGNIAISWIAVNWNKGRLVTVKYVVTLLSVLILHIELRTAKNNDLVAVISKNTGELFEVNVRCRFVWCEYTPREAFKCLG